MEISKKITKNPFKTEDVFYMVIGIDHKLSEPYTGTIFYEKGDDKGKEKIGPYLNSEI